MLKRAEMKRFMKKVAGKRISQTAITELSAFIERLLTISAQLAEHSHRSMVSPADIRFALAFSQPTKAEPATTVKERTEKETVIAEIKPGAAKEKLKPSAPIESKPEPVIVAPPPASPAKSPSLPNLPATAVVVDGIGIVGKGEPLSYKQCDGKTEQPAGKGLQQWRSPVRRMRP